MSDVVDQITLGLSRPYFRNILKKLRENNQENAYTICKHILTEQAEFNIKNSTKDGKLGYWYGSQTFLTIEKDTKT
ncbi:hypothetical protein [Candidatus Nitrosocosmicus sp. R]